LTIKLETTIFFFNKGFSENIFPIIDLVRFDDQEK
jgi:hypothetical protein